MPSSQQLTLGRSFALVFDHGEDFFPTLTDFCATHNIRQGYIPMFIAGFATVDIVGTCDKLDNPQAPVWTKVHLTNVEAVGAGTIAWNPATDSISPHIHVAVGLKELSAQGYTSHLLDARVQFLVEMIITEVAEPSMHRLPNPALYDAPQLRLGPPTPEA
ncbi:PPC domain-containing DNA-binding protein [Hamadaea sp. NPDC050747]|uniref:PPC domain-containing DNA-binding protein n=1 Tax=Hamadaea sp. NPDC050747 TaxID=3155789 RepID=UPI00340F26BC